MEFRPSTQEDLAYVRQNPFEEAVKDYPDMQCPDENTYTTLYENRIVSVGGCYVRWDGVAVFWLMLTADCKKNSFYAVIALSAIKEKVDELIEVNNLHRAEAYIRPDFEEAVKMIEFLGFRYEATMKKFFPDKTSGLLYAKVI